MRTAKFLAALLALAGAACTSTASPPPPPSDDAGRAFLVELFDRVTSGELGALCELGSGTCPHDLRAVEPASAPSQPPEVASSRVLAPIVASGDTWTQGGRLFEVCGSDGLGRRFRSEVLIFETGSGLRAVNAVFWTGARIATDGTGFGRFPEPVAPCQAG